MIGPGTPLELADILPVSFEDWTAEKTSPLHVAKDMYSYMDGGAELYLSYGFKEGLSRTYIKAGQPEVLAEVFDLVESRNAFGVFSQTREEENQQFGQGTYVIPGALFFWKDNYYISLSTWDPSLAADAFISKLAAYIDSRIASTGEIPAIVKLLPEEGMTPSGYKYFHHPVWINSYFFITNENLLDISDHTDAVIAKYEDTADQRKYLLLVLYDTPESAGKAYASFAREFFPEGLSGKCIQVEDETWLAADMEGNLVAAVFNAASQYGASQLLNRALAKKELF
jgi:hypothetical protein